MWPGYGFYYLNGSFPEKGWLKKNECYSVGFARISAERDDISSKAMRGVKSISLKEGVAKVRKGTISRLV